MLNDDVPWADAHLSDWDEVFKAFGAKPKRTPCSASALRKRVLKDGSLPSLDPVVDIYNAVSIRYAIPVGGKSRGVFRCAAPDAGRRQRAV
jgi:DNA/RNA-binding domain of Phe-tRNA-synthetase-like protein